MEKMKVVKLLATQSGVSQQTGNPWKSRDVILEAVQNAVHPDRYVARLFGDAVDKFIARRAMCSAWLSTTKWRNTMADTLGRLPSWTSRKSNKELKN